MLTLNWSLVFAFIGAQILTVWFSAWFITKGRWDRKTIGVPIFLTSVLVIVASYLVFA